MLCKLRMIISTSRDSAEAFVCADPFAVVSIADPDTLPARLLQTSLIARCNLQFWDLLEDVGTGQTFNSAMARRILKFVRDDCAGATVLLVHCEAGISRSTAVAKALGRVLGVEVRHQDASPCNPNSLVMRLVLTEAGVAVDGIQDDMFSEYRAALEERLRRA